MPNKWSFLECPINSLVSGIKDLQVVDLNLLDLSEQASYLKKCYSRVVRVLIAGSSGLAGTAISKTFLNNGFDVVGVNRSNLDLTDNQATVAFLKKVKPQIVIDAAAKVGGIEANNAFPVEFLQENIAIQGNLMGAAHLAGVDRFVFLGSSCIYPRDCAQPIKEEYLMTGPLESTNSAYAMAKIAGIELIKSYRKEYGLKWISLMPTNLYGQNDNFNLESSHVLPAFVRRFVEAADSLAPSVRLWGSGKPLREFLHADDLANAVLIAVQKYDSDVHLNVGTGQEVSVKVLAEKVAMSAGFKGEIEWDSTKLDGTPRKVLDVSQLDALGWKPTIGLDEGIASTINWYRKAVEKGVVRK